MRRIKMTTKREVYIHEIEVKKNKVLATITINNEDNKLFYELLY